ncbi:ethanolamine ammonia-lyase subunit EutC [Zoogloea sp.]|uniref:ethanolamine ammonia-lyase subunit EutC n=1 Tax=Zoogloea sp. TaxID=49181 RepID=UPI001416866B|nr:MAG: ethanolamine ammonia-lyase subunit EutC [Zoogloea sp.]
MSDIVTKNGWNTLTRFTQARIALGRAGTSLPTRPHLEFQFAHARARNAVHHPLDEQTLGAALDARSLRSFVVHSAAPDRATYLQRPDLGRVPSEASKACLGAFGAGGCDVAIVVVDGLSAFAIEQNVLPFLDLLLPQLAAKGLAVAPVAVVRQGRVAIGDPIAAALGAKLVVVLIGERPGLSSPDSMGIYMTWAPAQGTTDAQRNCISNVRRDGLPYDEAVYKLMYLISEAFRRGISGVTLKDETASPARLAGGAGSNFLLE